MNKRKILEDRNKEIIRMFKNSKKKLQSENKTLQEKIVFLENEINSLKSENKLKELGVL